MKKLIILFICIITFKAQAQLIETLGIGISSASGTVKVLYTDTINNILYAGGKFNLVGGKKCWGIAKWNGLEWDSLGIGISENGFVQNVTDIVSFNNEIIICGPFQSCGGKVIQGIARWDGTDWFSIGGSVDSAWESVQRLEVYNNELYAIGYFTRIGGVPTNGIAKWNGQNWIDLSQGFNLDCGSAIQSRAIRHFNNELYLVGNYNCPNDERIMKRVNNQWVQVGSDITGDFWLNNLTIFKNKLYVSGYFFAPYATDNGIFSFDGTNFENTNGGALPSNVWNTFEYKDELYVSGQIDFAGGQPIGRLAKWDGDQWLNTNINTAGTIYAMAEYNGKLIVGGFINDINGTGVTNLASIDFDAVGINNVNSTSYFKLYPNPTNSTFSIELSNFSNSKGISIYNAVGQLMLPQKTAEKTFDVSSYAKGMYVVEVQTDKGISRQKLIVK